MSSRVNLGSNVAEQELQCELMTRSDEHAIPDMMPRSSDPISGGTFERAAGSVRIIDERKGGRIEATPAPR